MTQEIRVHALRLAVDVVKVSPVPYSESQVLELAQKFFDFLNS